MYRKSKVIFALILCAGGLVTAFWYRWSSDQYATYRILTHKPVSGLVVGSPVELLGVEVGKVTKVELLDPRTVGILVSVTLDAPISQATVATVTARGLAARGFTGYVYVALENAGTSAAPLDVKSGQSYPIIASGPPLIDTLDTTIADAVHHVRILTQLLQSVLDPGTIAAVRASADSLQHVMTGLESNGPRMNSLIDNADQDSRDIRLLLDERTLSSLKQSVDQFQGVMATLSRNNARLGSLIVNADHDSRDARPLLAASEAVLGELTTQMLPRLYEALGDLDNMTRSVDGLASKMKRDPSSIIHGMTTPPGPGEQ